MNNISLDKPRNLPPSLREQKRYIVFELVANNPTDYGSLVNAIWYSMLDVFGELGTSQIGMWLIKNMYDEKKQRGVIRCNHNKVEELRIALTLIHMVSEEKVIIKVIGVTGTIKSAERKYLGMLDLKSFSG